MEQFEPIELNNEKYKVLIILTTYEPPLKYLDAYTLYLINKEYYGYLLIDTLMHSGNSNERFLEAFFDGEIIKNDTIKFTNIDKKNSIRKATCDLLRSNPDMLNYSILNSAQKQLINKGLCI